MGLSWFHKAKYRPEYHYRILRLTIPKWNKNSILMRPLLHFFSQTLRENLISKLIHYIFFHRSKQTMVAFRSKLDSISFQKSITTTQASGLLKDICTVLRHWNWTGAVLLSKWALLKLAWQILNMLSCPIYILLSISIDLAFPKRYVTST